MLSAFSFLQWSMDELPAGRQRCVYKLRTVACMSKTCCERTEVIDPEHVSLAAFCVYAAVQRRSKCACNHFLHMCETHETFHCGQLTFDISLLSLRTQSFYCSSSHTLSV